MLAHVNGRTSGSLARELARYRCLASTSEQVLRWEVWNMSESKDMSTTYFSIIFQTLRIWVPFLGTRCFCPLIIADWGSGSTKLLWTSSDISGAAAFQSPPFAIKRRGRASANAPRTFVHESTEGNTTSVRSHDLIPSFLPFVWSKALMNFIQLGLHWSPWSKEKQTNFFS